jgi:hypothetical protein
MEAVGTCVSCGKGLCRECANENYGRLYCGTDLLELELNAEARNEAREGRQRAQKRKQKFLRVWRFGSGAALILLGAAFIADLLVGFSPSASDVIFSTFVVLFGLFLIALGVARKL